MFVNRRARGLLCAGRAGECARDGEKRRRLGGAAGADDDEEETASCVGLAGARRAFLAKTTPSLKADARATIPARRPLARLLPKTTQEVLRRARRALPTADDPKKVQPLLPPLPKMHPSGSSGGGAYSSAPGALKLPRLRTKGELIKVVCLVELG